MFRPCVWMMLISNTHPLIGINSCNSLKCIFYNTRLKQVPTKEKIKHSTKTERVFYMKEFVLLAFSWDFTVIQKVLRSCFELAGSQ